MSLSLLIQKLFQFFSKIFGSDNQSSLDTAPTVISDNRPPRPANVKVLKEISEPSEEKEVFVLEESDKLTVEEMVAHLIDVESYTIHYNKGERGKTAPAGIYYKNFPHWEGWRFLTQAAQENGIDFDPAASDSIGCRALTETVRSFYKEEMDNLIEVFVRKEYYEKLHPEHFPGKKSALSFFSLTVHAGPGRAAKLLQKVLVQSGAHIAIDGRAGSKTFAALDQSGLDDDYLNQQLLLEMYFFYNRLVARSPSRYSRFYKGWVNRLKKLGFIEPTA